MYRTSADVDKAHRATDRVPPLKGSFKIPVDKKIGGRLKVGGASVYVQVKNKLVVGDVVLLPDHRVQGWDIIDGDGDWGGAGCRSYPAALFLWGFEFTHHHVWFGFTFECAF